MSFLRCFTLSDPGATALAAGDAPACLCTHISRCHTIVHTLRESTRALAALQQSCKRHNDCRSRNARMRVAHSEQGMRGGHAEKPRRSVLLPLGMPRRWGRTTPLGGWQSRKIRGCSRKRLMSHSEAPEMRTCGRSQAPIGQTYRRVHPQEEKEPHHWSAWRQSEE